MEQKMTTDVLPEAHHRKLSLSQAEEQRHFFDEATIEVPEEYFQGKSYDQLLADALRADYESLA